MEGPSEGAADGIEETDGIELGCDDGSAESVGLYDGALDGMDETDGLELGLVDGE